MTEFAELARFVALAPAVKKQVTGPRFALEVDGANVSLRDTRDLGPGAALEQFPDLLQPWDLTGGQAVRRLLDRKRPWDQIATALIVDADALIVASEGYSEAPKRWEAATKLVLACCVWAEDRVAKGSTHWRIMMPLLLRLRFHLLSAAFRFPHLGLARAFDRGLSEASARSRAAWVRALVEHEDHPLLALADGADRRWLEREVRLVVWSTLKRDGRLLFNVPSDTTVVHSLVTDVFLPRFLLADVLAASSKVQTTLVAAFYCVLAIIAGGVLVAASGGPMVRLLVASPIIAACAYLLVGGGVVWFGKGFSYLALLRLPAGAVLAFAGLLGLPQGWWSSPALPTASATIAAAGAAYLVIEARLHGAGAGASILRGLSIFALGIAHAIAMAVMLLTTLGKVALPGFFDADGSTIACGVLFAGCVGLGLGVFLQALWEDRPVTYPLAHMHWRRR